MTRRLRLQPSVLYRLGGAVGHTSGTCHKRQRRIDAVAGAGSAEFLGEPDENAVWPADVAEPVCGLVLDYFTADEIRTMVDQPVERVIYVVHCEHHSEVAQGVDRGVPVICEHLRRKEARKFEPAVPVRCAHHCDLDALVTQAGDAPCPLTLDHAPAFQFQAELTEELDRHFEIVNDDADVVHSEGHLASVSVRPGSLVETDGWCTARACSNPGLALAGDTRPRSIPKSHLNSKENRGRGNYREHSAGWHTLPISIVLDCP